MKHIDAFLNNITMYKVVLYGLQVMVGYAVLFGFLGWLPYSGSELVISLLVIIATCYLSNMAMGKFLDAPLNVESSSITAFILFCIMPPIDSLQTAIGVAATCLIAMASKYIFAIHKKHIFNPAAAGALGVALLGIGAATWWVATPVMLPATVIVGLLIVRKIRRLWLFGSFALSAVASAVVFQGVGSAVGGVGFLSEVLVSWPLFFLGTIMLTEPLTTPPTRTLQLLYGSLVGLLSNIQFSIGPLYSSPETALLIGNIFSYAVSPKFKLFLELINHTKLTPSLYEFTFTKPKNFTFAAGQYLEWTVPHDAVDTRGNRRYFTIASAPTEDTLKLGIKIPADGSSFKQALRDLKPGQEITGSQLSGDFTLPADPNKKLVFIAGGIGITPFRSMIKYLLDKKEKRDIVLLYCSSDPDEFAYRDIFDQAKKVGVTTHYVVTHADAAPKNWSGLTGRIDTETICQVVPEHQERTYYISGPGAMVTAYKQVLQECGVSIHNIEEDYFPGF